MGSGDEQELEQELERELLAFAHEENAYAGRWPSSANRGAALPGLCDLTHPCLLRILSSLSPEDLASLAQANRFFRVAASQPAVWRAHFVQRWGPEDEVEKQDSGQPEWRQLYILRDAADIQRTADDTKGVNDVQQMFIASARAKRSEQLSSMVCDNLEFTRPHDLPARVAAFRRDRGIPIPRQQTRVTASTMEATTQPGTACPGGCSYVELEPNVWICETGGHLHMCGEACTERRVDADEMLVCCLTGRVFGHRFEEHDDAWLGGCEAGEDDWNDEGKGAGRLGRAFLAGYTADRGEMFARFGVDL